MFRITTFVLLLCACSAIGRAQAADDFGSGLKRAITDYDTAWNKKDVATVSKFLADGYVYFTSTGGTTDRKRTIEFLSSPDYKLTFAERGEVVVHHVDGKIAVVSSRWKGRGTWKTQVINDDQRCGQVFVKENNSWKLLSEHCVQIQQK